MTSLQVIRLGGLGDLLVVLPSLNLLRRAFPGRRLALRCRPSSGALLRDRGVVDEVVSADAAERSPGADDLRIGWYQTTTSVPAVPGRFYVFDTSAGTTVSRFFFDRTAGLVRESGFTEEPDFAACARLPAARLASRSGPAILHPGSGSVRKRWPLDRFIALAEALARRGFGGLFVTGEADAGIAAGIREAGLPPGWLHLDSPPLAALASALESAPLYVGNDSGVTHLAAACGAPVVALFRTEFASHWRPAGRTILLASDEVDGIPLESALQAAAEAATSGAESPCAMMGPNERER
jgi:ADP-heptose:LPS heptosyltransferase